MPNNFAQRPIFFLGLSFFNEPEIVDSGPQLSAQDFYILKKSIDLSRVWTREPWISRRARYPETDYSDHSGSNQALIAYIILLWKR